MLNWNNNQKRQFKFHMGDDNNWIVVDKNEL